MSASCITFSKDVFEAIEVNFLVVLLTLTAVRLDPLALVIINPNNTIKHNNLLIIHQNTKMKWRAAHSSHTVSYKSSIAPIPSVYKRLSQC